MSAAARQTYARPQIGLHWVVVFLVAFQYLTGGGMAESFHSAMEGAGFYNGTAWVHGILGVSILLAMLARLAMRLSFGAPPPPETEPGPMQMVSRGVHFVFYAILIGMPLAGLAAVFLGIGWIAELHEIAGTALWVLIALHVLGAAYHVARRDGVIRRIMPGPR